MKLKKIRKSAPLLFLIGTIFSGFACKSEIQAAEYPVVGEPVPDFRLNNVSYYTKNYFDSRETRGKWLILDFWDSACSACIQSFPKVNDLSIEFKDSIQFLLIGNNNRNNKNIKRNFDRYTQNLGLKLPIAYDSAIFEKFKISGVPYVLIVDPQGIVYAITSSGSTLSRKNLQDLIALKKVSFAKRYDVFGAETPRVQWDYGSTENKISEDTFLYQSILSPFHGEQYVYDECIDRFASQGFFKVTNVALTTLCKFAWLGRATWGPRDTIYNTHWPFAILEIADTSVSLFNANTTGAIDKFNLYLSVPKPRANRAGLMKTLQADIQNYFGYTASIETRLMPCWIITATDRASKKLKSSYPKYQGESGADGVHAKHLPFEVLVAEIRHYSIDESPIFDETGIKDPIDIDFSAAMIDINDVKKALSKYGLILEKQNRKMKVLVIHDLAL